MPNHVHHYVAMPNHVYNQIADDGVFSLRKLIHLPNTNRLPGPLNVFSTSSAHIGLPAFTLKENNNLKLAETNELINLETYGFLGNYERNLALLGVKWEEYSVRHWPMGTHTVAVFSVPWSPVTLPIRALSLRTDEPIVSVAVDEGFNYISMESCIRGIRVVDMAISHELFCETINTLYAQAKKGEAGSCFTPFLEIIDRTIDEYKDMMIGYGEEEELDEATMASDALSSALGGSGDTKPHLAPVFLLLANLLKNNHEAHDVLRFGIPDNLKSEWGVDVNDPKWLLRIQQQLTLIAHNANVYSEYMDVLFGKVFLDRIKHGVYSNPHVTVSGKEIAVTFSHYLDAVDASCAKFDRDTPINIGNVLGGHSKPKHVIYRVADMSYSLSTYAVPILPKSNDEFAFEYICEDIDVANRQILNFINSRPVLAPEECGHLGVKHILKSLKTANLAPSDKIAELEKLLKELPRNAIVFFHKGADQLDLCVCLHSKKG